PLWPDRRCFHRCDWLAHPFDRPQPQAPDFARSCASHRGRSVRPYDLLRRRAADFAKNCAFIRGRSVRLYGLPPPPAARSARSCASHPARPCRPYWRSAVGAPDSSKRIRDSKYGRPELVREPLLTSSNNYIGLAYVVSEHPWKQQDPCRVSYHGHFESHG